MVRTYKRKLVKLDETLLMKAIEEVTKGQKLQTVAKKYNIARGTLRGRMNKLIISDPLYIKKADFRSAGICSLKEIIFRDADFMPSEIIDRLQNVSSCSHTPSKGFELKLEMDSSNDETNSQEAKTIPKAPLRKTTGCGPKPRKPAILTAGKMKRCDQKAIADKSKQITALIDRITENKVAEEALKKVKDTTIEGSRKVNVQKTEICHGDCSSKRKVLTV